MDHQKLVSPTHSPISSSPPQSASTNFLITAAIVVLLSALLLITLYVIKCYTNCRRINRLRRWRSRGGDNGGFALSSPDDGGGLDRSLIESIPTCEYARGGEWGNSCECAVCLNEFRDGEKLRVIPVCRHAFHVDCIDVWLISNANCPLCRNGISASTVFPISPPGNPDRGGSGYFTAGNNEDYVVIEIEGSQERLNLNSHLSSNISITPTPTPKFSRKLNYKKTGKVISSFGDECIDIRQRDEHFAIQPIRRSFSMDSAANQKLYLEVRKTLQQQKRRHGIISPGEGSSSSCSGSRIINKKSFFSFGYGRGSKNSVQTGSLGTLASLN